MIVLPFDSTATYTMTLTLGELDYQFAVYWKARDESWAFDISTIDGVNIFSGQRIATNTILSEAFQDRLPGMLIAISTDDQDDSDPGRNDLGNRVSLLYASPDEIV